MLSGGAYSCAFHKNMSRYKNWIKNAETPDEPDYHLLPYDEKTKGKVAAINFFFCVLMLLIQIAEGFVNQSSSRTYWVFFPYVFVFLPLAYLLAGSVSFFGMPVALSRKQWEKSLGRMKRSCIGVMIVDGISAVAELVYLIVYRTTLWNAVPSGTEGDILQNVPAAFSKEAAMVGGYRLELVYFGLQVMLLLCCVLYGFYYDRIFSTSKK